MGSQVNVTKGDQPPVGAAQDDLFIKQSDGTIYYFNGTMFVPINVVPGGAAGGVLSGTYPNPGMAAGAAAANLGAAGGALSGTYPSPGLANGAATGAALGSDVVKTNAANALTAAATLDASASSDTAGLKLPSKAGAAPTADGILAFDTTLHVPVFGLNGATAHPGLWMIADTTLGVAATNITFSSIPGTYKHLRLVISGRGDGAVATDGIRAQLSGDTGAHYNFNQITNTNTTLAGASTAGDVSMVVGRQACASDTASVAGGSVVDFPDYASTTLFKTAVSTFGAADSTIANSFAGTCQGCWLSTTAITSIKLFPSTSTNFVAGTRATLYGEL